jgi:hypothetical protein
MCKQFLVHNIRFEIDREIRDFVRGEEHSAFAEFGISPSHPGTHPDAWGQVADLTRYE